MIATKWPRLLVVGELATEAQADEILIRTNGWDWLGCNDREWVDRVTAIAAEFGRPVEPDYSKHDPEKWRAHHASMREWETRLGILSLSYLGNDRVMSSWIGGPHGWCDWSGQIGCANYNIGKWPSTEEVTDDWTAIAAAFPYLDLTAQCVEEEGEGDVCGTWRVVGGTVEYTDGPAGQIQTPRELSRLEVMGRFTYGHAERGVSEARLRQAFARFGERNQLGEAGSEATPKGSSNG